MSWRRITLVLLTTVAVLLTLLPPATAAPPKDPGPTASPPAEKVPPPKAGPAKEVATTPGLVEILQPASNTFVAQRRLRVVLRTAAGARGLDVTLGGRDVTSRFRRQGRVWVGVLDSLPTGSTYLRARVTSGARVGRAKAPVTVAGRTQDLIQLKPSTTGKLRHVATSGGYRVAFHVDGRATVTARLNGRAVPLSRPQFGNITTAVLTRDDGLRPGGNRLVVQAYLPNGRYEVLDRSFRIAAGLPRPEAGADRLVKPGTTMTLDGRRSVAGRPGNQLRYAWQVVEAPEGATPHISSANQRQGKLTFTHPGHYVVRLRVTERDARGRVRAADDLVTVMVSSDAPPIGERLQTLVPDPKTGQGLGVVLGDWRSWDSDFAGASVGMYVLNPTTLQFPVVGDNKRYFPLALSGDVDSQLRSALANVTAGEIVVVVGRAGFAGSSLLPAGPFSHVVAYDHGTPPGNFDQGVWNRNRVLGNGAEPAGPAGSLSGYLRYQVQAAGHRFVVDGNDDGFATATPSIASTGADDGAVYRLREPGGDTVLSGPPGGPGYVLTNVRSAAPAQQWQLVREYGQFYRLVNHSTGLCLSANPANPIVRQETCDPTRPVTQLWFLRYSDGTYRLSSGTTAAEADGGYLTRNGAGAVTLAASSSSKSQRWLLDIPPGTYTITDRRTGKAIAEPDDKKSDGVQLVTTTLTNELSQQWQLLDKPDGSFAFRNVASGLCMDVNLTNRSTGDGAIIERYRCDPNNPDQTNQRWTARPDAKNGLTLASATSTDQETLLLDEEDGKLVQSAIRRDETLPGWFLNRQPEPSTGGIVTVVSGGRPGTALDGDVGKAMTRAIAGSVASQTWTLADAGSGLVTIQNRGTGQCLRRTTEDEQALVLAASCTGAPDQRWRTDRQDIDGTYHLQTSGPTVLAITAQSDGTLTLSADDRRATDQGWTFHGRPITFTVGSQRYSTALPAGGSGFAVMAVDDAMRPLPGYPRPFATNGATGSGSDQRALADALTSLARPAGPAGVTVLLQSVGHPKPNSSTWNAIADGIGALGGNRSSLLELDGTGDYAMAGCAGCPPGQPSINESIRRQADDTVQGVRLEGTLGRDAESRLVPQTATRGRVDSTFDELANRPATVWPYSDSAAGRDALQAIADQMPEAMKLSGSCRAGLDDVRNSYCLQNGAEAGNWAGRLNHLGGLTYEDVHTAGSLFDKRTFNDVRDQLTIEWTAIQSVHQMMNGVRDIYYSNGSANVAADGVAEAIVTALRSEPQAPKVQAGGILEVVEASFSLLKTVVPLAVEDASGAGEEGSPVPDLIETGLGLVTAIVSVTGENSDDSTGVDLSGISVEASHYADKLDESTLAIYNNLASTENMLVTDPVKLTVAAANNSATWNASVQDKTKIQDQLKAGTRRDLWNRLFSRAFELWQWPTVPTDLHVTDINCRKSGGSTQYYAYTGQPDVAIFQPPSRVDDSGAVNKTKTLVLTRVNTSYLYADVNRVVPGGLLADYYAGTGYAPLEIWATAPFTLRNYPRDMDLGPRWQADQECGLQNRTTGTWHFFVPVDY